MRTAKYLMTAFMALVLVALYCSATAPVETGAVVGPVPAAPR
ncbi:hypothetical protein [Gemmatimonas sp.]|jgi:hypothetical protein|nr:hypothetical protein [Gemmatimonas sp.]